MRIGVKLKTFLSIYEKLMLNHMIRRIKNILKLRRWIKNGKPLPGPHFYKEKLIKYYAEKYSPDIFIETGTYHGDMIQAVKKKFKKIISVELNEDLYEKARNRFAKNSHIQIVFGDSTDKLEKILPTINNSCLFWLDAHFSGEGTAKGYLETPIMEELNLILNQSNLNHIILIDDARLFTGISDYPSIERVKNLVLKIHQDWAFILKDDIIRIYPKS